MFRLQRFGLLVGIATLVLWAFCFSTSLVFADGPLPFSEDFEHFDGSGFAPDPEDGQLDSDIWIVTGLSEGDLDFGDEDKTGDYARGTSDGGVTTGGVYAFTFNVSDAITNTILGIQPTEPDWTPGTFDLRIKNTTAMIITELDVSYSIWVLNNEGRANSLNFSYSPDNSDYTEVVALDYTSPITADTPSTWESITRTTTITGIVIPQDSHFYLRWEGDDVGGSGSRDEMGIDDVQVTGSGISLFKTVTPTTDVDYHGAITYTVVVSNSAAISDTNALLTDTLPTNVTFGSWIEQPSGASESEDELTWSGTLTNNTAITLSFTAVHTGDYKDVVANTAEYSGSVVISDTATFTVTSGDPDISISKTAEPIAGVAYHGEVTYTVSLFNSGPSDDENILFTDTLPAEVDFAHWVISPTDTLLNENGDKTEITWAGVVTAGEHVTFTFVVNHDGDYGDSVTNTAEFSGTVNVGSDKASFTVVAPDLTVGKTVAHQEDVQPGDFVTYTVVIRNDGDATARGVVVTDTLPPEVDFGAWVFQGSAELPAPADDEIVWGPWDITVSQVITYTFTAQVKTGSLYYNIPVTNTAEFDSINAGGGSSNDAVFNTGLHHIYLPLVARNYGQ